MDKGTKNYLPKQMGSHGVLGGANGYPILNARLLQARWRLQENVGVTRSEAFRSNTDHVGDEFSFASFNLIQSLAVKLEERRESFVRQIDGALNRLKSGTYGVCTRCEEPIATQRLIALPTTEHCIGCKDALEKQLHLSPHTLPRRFVRRPRHFRSGV